MESEYAAKEQPMIDIVAEDGVQFDAMHSIKNWEIERIFVLQRKQYEAYSTLAQARREQNRWVL